MVLGYLALMVALAPQLVPTNIGRRFEAAGQMALTNYLGMSFVMALIFQGWGLGLFDRFNRFEQWGFLVLGCVLMLALVAALARALSLRAAGMGVALPHLLAAVPASAVAAPPVATRSSRGSSSAG